MKELKAKNVEKVLMGKKSRKHGAAFEKRVRKDLEEKGWIVDKWTNNVELPIKKRLSWIEYFNKCDKCGEVVGRGNEMYIDNKEEDTIHLCDKCFNFSGKLVPAKNKWAGPGRPMMMGAGFPDFIAFRSINMNDYLLKLSNNMLNEEIKKGRTLRKTQSFEVLREIIKSTIPTHEVIGVESKLTGKLDKEEKEKARWLLDNNIFSKILVASKGKEIKTKCFWCNKFVTDLRSHCAEKHPKLSPRSYGETKEGRKIVVKYREFENV